MKRTIALFLGLFLIFSIEPVLRAQSFSELLTASEEVKSRYGESDDKYLEALSKAISAAFAEQKDIEANKYRLIHSEIVKKKYGVNSLEYAEDLWRLGNVSGFKGDAYTFECYSKAARIYESLNATSEFPYCNILWNYYLHYTTQGQWNMALVYLKRFIPYAKEWVDKSWKGNQYNQLNIAYSYVVLGDLYRFQLNNLSASTDAYKESVNILETYNLIESFEFSSHPYAGIVQNLRDQGEKEELVPWNEKFVEVERRLLGVDSDVFLKDLEDLQFAYWETKDLDGIKRASNELSSLLKDRAIRKNIDICQDSLYVHNLDLLQSFCVAFKDYHGVIVSSKELLPIYDKLGKRETTRYCDVLDDLILAYHNTQNDLKAYDLMGQYESLCKQLRINKTPKYCAYLGIKSEILTFLYKKSEFQTTISELLPLSKELYGLYSIDNFLVLSSIATNYCSTEDYSKAEPYVNQCLDILTSGKCEFESPKDTLIMSSHIHGLRGMMLTPTSPDDAEKELLTAIAEWESVEKRAEESFYVNLGRLYCEQKRNFYKALEHFETAKKISEGKGAVGSSQYFTILNNIALCYQELGNNSRAIAILDSSCKQAEGLFGKYHPSYVMALQNKSNFLSMIGDVDAGIALGEEALSCMAAIYGERSEKYATVLQNLGISYMTKGDALKAEHLLKEAISICEQTGNQALLLYSYSNLMNVYSSAQNWKGHEEIAKRCEKLLARPDLKNSDLRASVDLQLGIAASLRGDTNSQKYFERSASNMGNTKGKNSLEYLYCLLAWEGASGYKNEELVPQIVHHYIDIYSGDIAFMNAGERESIVNNRVFQPIKNTLFSSRHSDKNDASLFDYLLFSKGLLLGTSRNYADYILSSGNESLKGSYSEFLTLKSYLNGDRSVSLSFSRDEAREKADSLERTIITTLRETPDFSQTQHGSFKEIRQALKPGEVAIEFVNYFDYNREEEVYAALLVRGDKKAPIFIPICTSKSLGEYLNLSPGRLYSVNDDSKALYSLIWKPITPYLKTGCRVFFSPSGLLYRLAIEYLGNGKQRFDEAYSISRVTSTREILYDRQAKNLGEAVLYGGLTYDEDVKTMTEESLLVRGEASLSTPRFRGFTSSVTRNGWEYLPGTLDEVTSISSVLAKDNHPYTLFSGNKGNEESFKSLSGKNFWILHIATHGFYMTSTEAESHAYLSPILASINDKSSMSSLARSGLLLSGGNMAWRGDTIPEGIEDGVLTAEEVANLDFNTCDIVVLSACETGLGDISDEGVFGLQRAFKNAGVRTIIMSLWDVDDHATSVMMQSFYKNLLAGKGKEEAFKHAQSIVRQSFPDSRYWAAFIMLD